MLNRKDIYLLFDVPGEVWVRSEAESLPFREGICDHTATALIPFATSISRGLVTERLGRVGRLTDAEFVELKGPPAVVVGWQTSLPLRELLHLPFPGPAPWSSVRRSASASPTSQAASHPESRNVDNRLGSVADHLHR